MRITPKPSTAEAVDLSPLEGDIAGLDAEVDALENGINDVIYITSQKLNDLDANKIDHTSRIESLEAVEIDIPDPPEAYTVGLVKNKLTSGNLARTNTSYAALSTALDIVLPAAAGDVLLIGASFLLQAAGDHSAHADFATIVSGNPVNYVASTSTGQGFMGMWVGAGQARGVSVELPYKVQAGDISDGTVTVRLLVKASNVNSRTYYAVADTPAFSWGVNLGPASA